MKKRIMDLVLDPQVCFDRWRVYGKEWPTRKTLHTGKHGVSVLGFDYDEYLDSGSCIPFEVLYDFRKKEFLSVAHGGEETIWVEAGITHWMPLPSGPLRKLEIIPVRSLNKYGIHSIDRPEKIVTIFEKKD
jgi:hypothetical protein